LDLPGVWRYRGDGRAQRRPNIFRGSTRRGFARYCECRRGDEVGALSRHNPAKLIGAAEKFGTAQRGGFEGGERSKAGFDEQGHLVMQAEAWHAVGFMTSVPASNGTPARNIIPTICSSALKSSRYSSNS